MARGGINKQHVSEAYEALLLKGQNPSIDAIRIELGNTGSKSTIHRYLKEIEQDRGTRLDDEALLSDTLKDMVSQLAARLHEEANAIIGEANVRHDVQLKELNSAIAALQKQLSDAQENNQGLTVTLEDKETKLQQTIEALQLEKQQVQRLQQQVQGMDTQLTEKNDRIQSLEEKHTHARESLEHYRQSVKEQRDQDQRRHEQQLQQGQAESRKLGQDIIVKQEQISQLNKDNARLVTELKESKKQELKYETLQQQSIKEITALTGRNVKLEATLESQDARYALLLQELEKANTALTSMKSQNRDLELELVKARADVDAKSHLINEFNKRFIVHSDKTPV